MRFTDLSLLDEVVLQNNTIRRITSLTIGSRFKNNFDVPEGYIEIVFDGAYLVEYDEDLKCVDDDLECDKSDFNILTISK